MTAGPDAWSRLYQEIGGGNTISNVGSTTINNTATLIFTASGDGVSIILYNSGSNTIYLGNASVTASGSQQGLQIPPGSYSPSFVLANGSAIYGITASSTSTVNGIALSL